jgi:ribosomal protein S18 acetylase RimI-like enzyme
VPDEPLPAEWTQGEYTVTCDRARVDLAVVRDFLSSSYWAAGVPQSTIEKSIEHSLCLTLLAAGKQIGFARVITDRATFAYLADVFVLEAHRGRGLGQWLVRCALAHPELEGLRRWMLATRDAHGLYRRFGFTPLARPATFMERHDPDVYLR